MEMYRSSLMLVMLLLVVRTRSDALQTLIQLAQSSNSGSCSSLREENLRLQRLLVSLLQSRSSSSPPLDLAHSYLEQALQPEQVRRVLVTPTPTWSTMSTTSEFETVTTIESTSLVPIIWRGSKVTTTIIDTRIETVSTTTTGMSSVWITPTPTWDVITVQPTSTTSPKELLAAVPFLPPSPEPQLPTFWPLLPSKAKETPVPRPGSSLRQSLKAHVQEIESDTAPSEAKSQLDRLRQAYQILAANEERRRQNFFRFNSLGIRRKDNNLFDDNSNSDEYDQQVLEAEHNPVVYSVAPTKSSRVVTLYFSGSVPGEYSTSLSTVFEEQRGRQRRSVPIEPTETLKETISSTVENSANMADVIAEDGLQSSCTDVVTVVVTSTVTLDECGVKMTPTLLPSGL